jgi:hypothetical protein
MMIKLRTNPSLLRSFALSALLVSVAGTAQAENNVVVELYTSQGCSSCPAADKVLKSLSTQSNVIALSLNVDYWDYLGWEDDLALAGNSKRQRKYAKVMRSRHVYTPQLMVDGKMDVIGSRRSQVDSAVASHSKMKDQAQVDAKVSGDTVQVSVRSSGESEGDSVIWLVGYDSSITKQIGAGENRGRSIEYSNVVREWREVGRWDGKAPLDLQSTRPKGGSGFAVIVQKDEVGPILGATQVHY